MLDQNYWKRGSLMKLRKIIASMSLALAVVAGGLAAFVNSPKQESKSVDAADYSSTIRVYVDLGWDNINYVRVGGNAAGNNTVLTSSNAKYNQDLGKYVLDISSGSVYDKMGCFFSQSGTAWEYQYDGGYIWIDDSKFAPGYEFQIKNINWVADGNPKKFSASVYRIGEIRDNAQNSTFYLVDGYSWHSSASVYAYFWGGTASCASFPGNTMSDSSLRLKAFVGETEYSGLQIFEYTLSGSAAYVKFSNGSGQETGDLSLYDGGVYFYGVADTYLPVVNLLISLKSNLGSYTYGGRTYTKSICALNQTKAKAFVDTYDNLAATGGSGIASSVPGSGIVTYNNVQTDNTSTGEVPLSEVRTALINKYPSIVSSSRVLPLISAGMNTSVVTTIVVVSLASLTAIGGYIFLKRRKDAE